MASLGLAVIASDRAHARGSRAFLHIYLVGCPMAMGQTCPACPFRVCSGDCLPVGWVTALVRSYVQAQAGGSAPLPKCPSSVGTIDELELCLESTDDSYEVEVKVDDE